MKAYSIDLRQRVVTAVEQGLNKSAAARTFQVDLSTVKRWVRLKTATGSLEPKPRPGLAPRIHPDQYPALAAQMRAQPDAALQTHCQRWTQEHHQTLSVSTLSRTLKRMKWSRKKKFSSQ